MAAVVQYPGRSFTKVQAVSELMFSASQSSFPKHAECHTAGGVGSGAVVARSIRSVVRVVLRSLYFHSGELGSRWVYLFREGWSVMNERLTVVLVVGAGPTGLTMANQLARQGTTVRIIDSAPAPPITSRALVVMPRTLEIFDDMGVINEAIAAGNQANGFSLTFKNKKVRMDVAGLLTGPQNATGYPALRTLSQHDTDRIRGLGQAGRQDRARSGAERFDPRRRYRDRAAAWPGRIA